MTTAIKITLAILFFICLADMPYGYYEFVWFVGLVGFAVLAYQANDQGKQGEIVIFVSLALLFQPFFKIALGREIWNVVDVVVGIGLILSIFASKSKCRRRNCLWQIPPEGWRWCRQGWQLDS
jgi:hypothetical protein